MKIALVTEFPIDACRWHQLLSRKLPKFGHEYIPVYFPNRIRRENENIDLSRLKDADFVFVYASNYCHGYDVELEWKWWKLPLEVKKYLKPETKMAAMWDFEGWLESGLEEPEGLKEVMDVTDIMFTIFPDENPKWKRLTDKPVKYMPFPLHAERFKIAVRLRHTERERKYLLVVRHSPTIASANHTIDNIASKIRDPMIYLSTAWASAPTMIIKWANINPESIIYGYLQDSYEFFRVLRICYAAIDDNEGYYGWSRFIAQCAIVGVPVVTTENSGFGSVIFPELCTKHKDYCAQIELLERLRNDEDFRNNISKLGFSRLMKHVNTSACLNRLFNAINIAFGYKIVDTVWHRHDYIDLSSLGIGRESESLNT